MIHKFRVSFRDTYKRIELGALAVMAALSVFLLAWEFGFYKNSAAMGETNATVVRSLDYVIFAIFSARSLASAFFTKSMWRHLRSHILRHVVFVMMAVAFIAGGLEIEHEAFFVTVKLFIFLSALGSLLYYFIKKVRFNPALSLIISFVFIIFIGCGLLMLPRATVNHDITFIDALFTASSATCVTGLIVQDTGTYFTPFGQVIIMLLFQVGGLGLMTFVAFFALTVGRGMYIREQVMMRDVLSATALGGVGRVVVFIFSFTLIMELAGTLAYIVTIDFPKDFDFSTRLYYSVFHSISAFCNAGFSLWKTSFEGMRGNFFFNISTWLLIIIGGLGFGVNMDLMRVRWRLGGFFQSFGKKKVPPRFELQTKLVLLMTGTLLFVGFLSMLVLEWDNLYRNLGFGEKVLSAGFQSVTARTAGFNTTNTAALSDASKFLMIVFMFIGASPGGTGGGIKTSTFFLCLLSIYAIFRRRRNVEAFKRSIPDGAVNNTLVIIVTSIFLIVVSAFIFAAVEEGKVTPDGVKIDFLSALFEVTSAFGTVGLSTGITGSLSAVGKTVLIITMFLGRLGPLTVVLAMAYQRPVQDYDYPSGRILIG